MSKKIVRREAIIQAAIEVFSKLLKFCRQHHPDLIMGAGSIEDAPTAALKEAVPA